MSELTAARRVAAEIQAEHRAVERDLRNALGHAIRCGELLIEAKGAVGHGEWLPWLTANFEMSRQTAASYMRLAEAPNVQELLHLTKDAALKRIATPKERPALPAGGGDDWMLAYIFGCGKPVPERFRRAMELMLECAQKREYLAGDEWLRPPDDWRPAAAGDEVGAHLRELRWIERERTASGTANRTLAESVLLEHEIGQLVPELVEDPKFAAGVEKRSKKLQEMADRALADLGRPGDRIEAP
jgi:hypothetical protein